MGRRQDEDAIALGEQIGRHASPGEVHSGVGVDGGLGRGVSARPGRRRDANDAATAAREGLGVIVVLARGVDGEGARFQIGA